jgi:clumping factor B
MKNKRMLAVIAGVLFCLMFLTMCKNVPKTEESNNQNSNPVSKSTEHEDTTISEESVITTVGTSDTDSQTGNETTKTQKPANNTTKKNFIGKPSTEGKTTTTKAAATTNAPATTTTKSPTTATTTRPTTDEENWGPIVRP